MMQLRDLCLALVRCESEEEVITLLKAEKYWDKEEYWQFFGGDEGNFSIIGNQQSKPETAIVEKIINSVDAMLLGECLKRDINPESSDAPQSISDALITYFKIDDGKLTNITSKERSLLAENILLIATGQKTKPNYAIVDKGEGQSPARLPETILSLRKSNKLRIPFVQGKYNMGGTGVFTFCGERNIQLIVSRRNPEIAAHEGDPSKDMWGFTVIRRDDAVQGARSSNYKYLAPVKQILYFPGEELPILPKEYPNAFGNPMQWGTYIKFFEYKIGPGLKTNVILDLNYKLSVLMPHIALPVKLYERRKGYEGHSMESVLSGLSVRVDEDRSNNLEDNFPTTGTMMVDGQKMKYSIYVFRKDRHKHYTNDEGIIFTINGQTHGYLPKAFYTRKSVGLGYLADSILVILDCSEISSRSREDLFMNSRDRLRSCPFKTEIERKLETTLNEHPGLRALKDKRRREEIENKLSDQKPLKDVLQNILKKSPTLSRLFIQGLKLQSPFNLIPAAIEKEYHGKEFPTHFTLSKKYSASNPKSAHKGSKFRVEFKTDAQNDYFDRSKDPGNFKLFVNGKESEYGDINLWNGYAYLNVSVDDVQVGDLILFRSEITDVSRLNPFSEDFHVRIIEPLRKGTGEPGGRKPPSSDNEGTGSKKADGYALPNIIEVAKDGRKGHNWEQHGFNEQTALIVKDGGDAGYDFFVNIDNINLQTELKSAKPSDIETIESKYKFGLVLIGLAMLNQDNKEEKVNEEGDNIESDILIVIAKTTQAVSSVIIPMIDSLGSLELTEEPISMEDPN